MPGSLIFTGKNGTIHLLKVSVPGDPGMFQILPLVDGQGQDYSIMTYNAPTTAPMHLEFKESSWAINSIKSAEQCLS